jgi:hypothetical protein
MFSNFFAGGYTPGPPLKGEREREGKRLEGKGRVGEGWDRRDNRVGGQEGKGKGERGRGEKGKGRKGWIWAPIFVTNLHLSNFSC